MKNFSSHVKQYSSFLDYLCSIINGNVLSIGYENLLSKTMRIIITSAIFLIFMMSMMKIG